MSAQQPKDSTERHLQWLLRLCEADTTSGREDAGLPGLRSILVELGAAIHEQPVAAGRTNVLATWGDPRVLFSTHLDTVPPFLPPRSEDGVVHGRGTCDAKGQIVAQLAAIEALIAAGRDGLAWLGVVGEETDSAGAVAALNLAPRLGGLRALINGEPTEGRLATGQRGIQRWRLCCEGSAAHSGTPQLGRNAAWPLLDWLQRLRELPLPEDPELGAEIWNLGLLKAGEAPNVVPSHAEADLLVRSLPGSLLGERIQSLAPPEGRAELLLTEPADRYPELPGFPRAAMPFGSDTPRLRDLVADRTAVLAGPGSITVAHTDHEHLHVADLEAGIDLNRRLALHFLDR